MTGDELIATMVSFGPNGSIPSLPTPTSSARCRETSGKLMQMQVEPCGTVRNSV